MLKRNHLQPISEFISERQECKDIVQALFGLNHLEFTIFCSLNMLKKADINEIMKYTKRNERTRVNRALLKLLEENLCTRAKEKTPEGTTRYYYSPIPIEVLQERLEKKLDNWYAHALNEIKNMKEHFEAEVSKKN